MNNIITKTSVIGNPIQHSLSPIIHNYWIEQNKINTDKYKKIKIEASNLHQEVKELIENGFTGLNVTIPFKEMVYDLCDEVSDTVKILKAINTITYKDKKVIGYNTDPDGFINSISNQIRDDNITGKDTLVIGAGGSARSIIYALNKMESNITVTNRTVEKVEIISQDLDIPIKIKDFETISDISKFDLIVNTTSLGMEENKNLEIIFANAKSNLHVYDLIYNPYQTNLLKDAEANGLTFQNGLAMLVYQAAESFNIWHGIYPKIDDELFSIIGKSK
jgi:shikimate dehydrogenase|tara:strand:+ start:1418 stop:2248 length:831 start_codon:yes stop_codon:yes gene_type:complete